MQCPKYSQKNLINFKTYSLEIIPLQKTLLKFVFSMGWKVKFLENWDSIGEDLFSLDEEHNYLRAKVIYHKAYEHNRAVRSKVAFRISFFILVPRPPLVHRQKI